MSKNTLRLVVVTPDKNLIDQQVNGIALQTTEGGMEVFYDHQPMVVTLGIGPFRFTAANETKELAVSEGFVHILPETVMVISDAAEWPGEIDIERAKEAKERAERRLRENQIDINLVRAETALERALLRIDIASRHNQR